MVIEVVVASARKGPRTRVGFACPVVEEELPE
jgi:hypothetical protein